MSADYPDVVSAALSLRSQRAGWWLADVLTAVGLAVAMVAEALADGGGSREDLLAAVLLTSTVAWRRWSPVAAVATGLVAASLLHQPGRLAETVLVPTVVVLGYYMLGRRPGRQSRRPVDVLLVVVGLLAIWMNPQDRHLVDVLSVWLFFFVLPFAAGRAISSRDVQFDALARDALRVELDQEEQARQAIATERTRIARDLHDVVAHHVSVMAIQVVAARQVAPTDGAAARAALETVAACGREALVEMRRIVGVLRRNDLELDAVAAPGLGQVDSLAARARMAGVDVDVRVEGMPYPLPAARDLVAFRVVQEALTNVVKHAGLARALVTVRYEPSAVALTVSDDGAAPLTTSEHGGQGLVGMRERLGLYGGTVRAGARPEGGFEVTALLPRAGSGDG